MKRLRLRRWVKVTLAVVGVAVALMYGMVKMANYYDSLYQQCEDAYGRTCSYYEMQNYTRTGKVNN